MRISRYLFIDQEYTVHSNSASCRKGPRRGKRRVRCPYIKGDRFRSSYHCCSNDRSPRVTFAIRAPPVPFRCINYSMSAGRYTCGPLRSFVGVFRGRSSGNTSRCRYGEGRVATTCLHFCAHFQVSMFRVGIVRCVYEDHVRH